MSYISHGSGPDSRNAQFVVHQCVALQYAMRVFFLHLTLQVLHHSRVEEPERISMLFLNSQKASSFSSIQNIKRPAKLDIPEFGDQKITWEVGSEYTALKDSPSSTRPGEGMVTFNPSFQAVNQAFVKEANREARLLFMSQAGIVYRLALAAIHLSGGPSPRGTEDAVTRLTNSTSSLKRNVQAVRSTIGVANGYVA